MNSKYIILLCCCLAGIAAHAQRADTAAVVSDSTATPDKVAVDTSVDNEDGPEDTLSVAALQKFSLKDTGYLVRQRKLAAGDVKNITSDDAFWYANKNREKPKPEQNDGFWDKFFGALASKTAAVIFWVVIGGCFIAILAMYLANSKVGFFAAKAKKIGASDAGGDDGGDGNIFETDFDARVNKALEAYDYRLATRLLFLRILRTMAEKKVISYSMEKTNMDYMFELGNTKYFKEFSTVSRNYEYVWYGNFVIDHGQFVHLRQKFDDLNQQIKN